MGPSNFVLPPFFTDPRCIDSNRDLIQNAKDGNLTKVEFILEYCNEDIDVNFAESSYPYNTPLMYASGGHSEVVELLLKHPQIDINKGNFLALTALHNASYYGHSKVVELLLQHPQIDVNKETDDGETAILGALNYEHSDNSEVIELLLQHPQIDVNKVDNNAQSIHHGCTALYKAVFKIQDSEFNIGLSKIIKLLIQHPQIDVNKGDVLGYGYGETALYRASFFGMPEVVELLLQHPQIDININTPTSTQENGWTALHASSAMGHSEVVKLLLQYPQIDVNKEDNYAATALYEAYNRGRSEVVELLLQHPEIDLLKGFNMSLNSIEACLFGREAYITGWHGQQFDVFNTTNDSLLLTGAVVGNLTRVQEELEKNAIAVDSLDDWGMTALMWASKNGYFDIVRILLNTSEVDINKKRRSDSATALMLASYNGHKYIVEILLSHEDVDLSSRTTSKGESAQIMAASNGYEDIVKSFVEVNRADINEVNTDGESSLYKAVEGGHVGVIQVLLNNTEIDVNKATVDRATALMASVLGGHYNITRSLLIHQNIKVNFVDFVGKNALFYSVTLYYNVNYRELHDVVDLFLRCPSFDINHLDETGKNVQAELSQKN